jgi:hypothetical protein
LDELKKFATQFLLATTNNHHDQFEQQPTLREMVEQENARKQSDKAAKTRPNTRKVGATNKKSKSDPTSVIDRIRGGSFDSLKFKPINETGSSSSSGKKAPLAIMIPPIPSSFTTLRQVTQLNFSILMCW